MFSERALLSFLSSIGLLKEFNIFVLQFSRIDINSLYSGSWASLKASCIESKHRPLCPHCQGNHVVKNGHDHGVQRYICRECGKPFGATTNTIFYSTKLSYKQWIFFIQCELMHLTLRESAQTIGVSQTAAFSMHHKLYDAIKLLKKIKTIR